MPLQVRYVKLLDQSSQKRFAPQGSAELLGAKVGRLLVGPSGFIDRQPYVTISGERKGWVRSGFGGSEKGLGGGGGGTSFNLQLSSGRYFPGPAGQA
jgi:hypothetical protein